MKTLRTFFVLSIVLQIAGLPSFANEEGEDYALTVASSGLTECRQSRMLDSVRTRNAKWIKAASAETLHDYFSAVSLALIKKKDVYAVSVLNRLLARSPNFEPGFVLRATIESRSNQFVKAIEDANRALKLDPEDERPLRTRMFCYSRLRRSKEALADINRLIAKKPMDVSLLKERSRIFERLSDRKSSLRDLAEAREKEKFDGSSISRYSQSAEERQQIITWLNAKLANSRDPVLLLKRADLLIANASYWEALADLTEARKNALSQIQLAVADYSAARCLLALNHVEDALKELDKATAIFEKRSGLPGDFDSTRLEDAFAMRIEIYMTRKKFKECQSSCNAYIKSFPLRSYGFVKRADLYAAEGKFLQAKKDYDRAISIRPENEHALLSLAQLSETVHDLKSAIDYLGRLISLCPEVADFYLARARLLRKDGNLNAALADYDKMVGLSAGDPVALEERAQVEVRLGNRKSAILDLRKAIEASPEDVERLRKELSSLEK